MDGVIVSTDECHYEAWKRMADDEGINFDRKDNERLRGVSRMQSLDIILERSCKNYSERQKNELAERKNNYYKELIQKLTPKDILPGAKEIVRGLKNAGIKVAIGSSSKNAPLILERIGMNNEFDVIMDGNNIKRGKPDPEVFVKVAETLEIPAYNCLVVEDADAGVEAAHSAGMEVLGVGTASKNPTATIHSESLSRITVDKILIR